MVCVDKKNGWSVSKIDICYTLLSKPGNYLLDSCLFHFSRAIEKGVGAGGVPPTPSPPSPFPGARFFFVVK